MDEPKRSTVEEHKAGACRGYYGCTTCAEEIGRLKTLEAEGPRHRTRPLTREEIRAVRRAKEARRAKARAARKARRAQRRTR